MTKEEMSSKLVEIVEFINDHHSFHQMQFEREINHDLFLQAFVGNEISEYPIEEVNRTIRAAYHNGCATILRKLNDIMSFADEYTDEENE